MIGRLAVEGFTVFPHKETFSFVPGVNIVVGGNDSGKSHLIKLCYALCKWAGDGTQRNLPELWAEEKRLRQTLLRVFGTRRLGALSAQNRGNDTMQVLASLSGEKVSFGHAELGFRFAAGCEEEGLHIDPMPNRFLSENAVFISPREVLSIYPCYVQAGRRYPELLDSAGWELCRALEAEPEAPPANEALCYVIRSVEGLLNGKLQRENGRFYLRRPGQEPLELNLIAEGFKRIGTLGLLVGNGSVRPGTTLFWDEPEMNLNTSYLPALVKILLGLAHAGVQVLLTTHSLFLLREFVIQLASSSHKNLPRRFFGLQAARHNFEGICTSVGDSPEELDPIESLQAEMEQADRYLQFSMNGNA